MGALRLKSLLVCVGVFLCFALGVSIAVPVYQKVLVRSRESVLKNDLLMLRTAIDRYIQGMHREPKSLQDLVRDGYLPALPIDPLTKSSTTWRMAMLDTTSATANLVVRSGSDLRSLEGTLYSEW
jgi:general secretion pathway protein G